MSTIKADTPHTSITPFLIIKCNRTCLGKLYMGPQPAFGSGVGIAWEKIFNTGAL